MICSCIRGMVPLIFGFFLGSLLSLFIFPSLQRFSSDLCVSKNRNLQHQRNSELLYSDDIENRDDFDPVIIQTSSPKVPQNKKLKIVRPRFYATELGVKDKLCVSILINDGDNLSLATALNKTVAHHVNRLLFFDSLHEVRKNNYSLPVIGLSRKNNFRYKTSSQIYSALNHVIEYYANNYDWFFFVPDASYIKAFKLFEFVTHLSVGYDVVLGKKEKIHDSLECSLKNGILLSNGALKKVAEHLPKCESDYNNGNGDQGIDFEKCLEKYTDLKCTEEWNGKTYRSLDVPLNVDTLDFLSNFGAKDNLNQLLTVANIGNAADIYRLHKHFCTLELEQIAQLMSNVEDGILNSSEEVTWPSGLPQIMHPKSRYEAFRWDFFTSSEIFEIENDRNVRSLDGVNKLDVEDLMKFLQRKFRRLPEYSEYLNISLDSGYRKFDPSRGMDYILDLNISLPNLQKTEIYSLRKRVRLLRPLSRAEIVPVPYVTESARINVILPLTIDESLLEPANQFFADYAHSCLETEENSRLHVVFLSPNLEDRLKFRNIIELVDILKRKYAKPGVVRVSYSHVQHINPKNLWLDSVNAAIQLFGSDQLYLMVTPWTNLRGDFFNRVRMNSIQNFQIFFPIPFVRYHPKFVKFASDRLEVNKYTGRFDRSDFAIAGFYGTDFVKAKQKLEKIDNIDFLIDLFLPPSYLHIIRAVDPSLIVNYNNKICDNYSEDYGNCSLLAATDWKERFASKSQLAALVLEKGLL